jgi:[NiFe] hydrogenase diaphorase moiety small subunit
MSSPEPKPQWTEQVAVISGGADGLGLAVARRLGARGVRLILLDFNRCILCELCVRAAREVDGKHVFSLAGRGLTKHLIVNSESGRLVDTDVKVTDKAVEVCPVGVIIRKRVGFATPLGERRYDGSPISAQALADAPRPLERHHD